MNKLFLIITALLAFSCNNKEPKTLENSQVATTQKTDTVKSSKIDFDHYQKNGILLAGVIQLFDENRNPKEKLEIKEVSKIQILEKSKSIYNIGGSTDYCLKSNFIKINYNGQNHIVFGKDVYEINDAEKHDFTAENDKFSVFSITNYEIGASDDEGLTSCDDFSILIIQNKNNQKYFTIPIPENQAYKSNTKFANLIHDDGSLEEIYNSKIVNDTLVLGIKIGYQEGFGSYFLKTNLKDNFSKSIISNVERFEDESKYNDLK